MEFVKTKQAVYEYLIAPSPLFLKQVVTLAETKAYILVMDSRLLKKRSIPDSVIQQFETRLQYLQKHTYKGETYDGVTFLLIPK